MPPRRAAAPYLLMNFKYNRRLIVYLCVLVALLPLVCFRDVTPDNELRYLSIADEALRYNHGFAFYSHGEPYADKPPLYIWLAMLARWLFDDDAGLFLMLFSVIPAFVVAEVMDRWSRPALSEDCSVMATLLLLSCGLFAGMMAFLRMDMLMTMWIVLALRCFFVRWQDARSPHPTGCRAEGWWFPVFVFLAVFTKGPLGFLIPLFSIIVFLWQRRRLKWFFLFFDWRAWSVLGGLCAIWLACVYAEGGGDYLYNLTVHQTLGRAVNSFHHNRPPWYYLTTMTYSLLPWTLLAVGGVVAALTRKARWRSQKELFFLLTSITIIVLLSLIGSKMQVYMLPAYPFLLYLAAIYVSRYRTSRWVKAAVAVPATLLCAGGLAVWSIVKLDAFRAFDCWEVYAAGSVLALAAGGALWLLFGRRDTPLAINVTAGGIFAAIFIAGFAVADLNPHTSYGPLGRAAYNIATSYDCDGYYAYRIHRAENMDVYFHKRVGIIADTVADPVKALPEHGRWVLMTPADAIPNDSDTYQMTVGRYEIHIVDNPPWVSAEDEFFRRRAPYIHSTFPFL